MAVTPICWSSIVKSEPAPKIHDQRSIPSNKVFVESCKSSKGIAVAVVDANALIQGVEQLSTCADKFVSVPEVLDEVRDANSQHRLAFLPFTLDPMEPSPEALDKVIKFSRATGDFQTLSDVDLKLIALTYMLEAQIHGTKQLRDSPPPVHMVNVKRLPEKDMPGWGNNVPNLEEWEALDQEVEVPSNPNSRILPLQDLSLNTIPSDTHSENGSVDHGDEVHYENEDDGSRKPRRYPPKKREINIEGKKMVANGVDASKGLVDDDEGEWMPAVSRSTHRRYLRRKAKRENHEALSEKDGQQDEDEDDQPLSGKNVNENLSEVMKQMNLKEDGKDSVEITAEDANSDSNVNMVVEEGDEIDIENEGSDHAEVSSQSNESIDVSCADDDNSEQSWMLRSLSESSIACITSDFAMQNVILQMGLRLLAPGGMQIRQLHRWILKCHACFTVTAEIGRIFCPKCGNGGTLRKVAVKVGQNGIVLSDRKPRISLRGTKYSLPSPQGGRDAITKNPILREDQLPQKFLYPKTKKKANKQEDDLLFTSDDLFSHHGAKKAPLQPPIRKALAVFSGKRNPNDNHYSRSNHR